MNKAEKYEVLNELAKTPKDQKIQKIRAIINGEMTVYDAFEPITKRVKLWREVEPGLFEEDNGGRRLTSEEIRRLPNKRCITVQIITFQENGEPVG